jgi:hypothetical protein
VQLVYSEAASEGACGVDRELVLDFVVYEYLDDGEPAFVGEHDADASWIVALDRRTTTARVTLAEVRGSDWDRVFVGTIHIESADWNLDGRFEAPACADLDHTTD